MCTIKSEIQANIPVLKEHIKNFKKYLLTEEGKKIDLDRKASRDYFQIDFKNKLDNLSAAVLEEMANHLWAAAVWGNKAYYAQKLIDDNGGEAELKAKLSMLFSEKDPLKVVESFSKNIKGFSPSTITEMVMYIFPEVFIEWNRRTKEALDKLEIRKVSTKQYLPTKEEYRKFIDLSSMIGEMMKQEGITDTSPFYVDFFYYFCSEKRAAEKKPAKIKSTKDWNHDEIKDLIANIGLTLGFDTSTEVPVGIGAVVDCVWTAKIGNLGTVRYIFEVQSKGSIDSLVLNLQKANADPRVQKVIAVSDESQLKKIDGEVQGLSDSFTKNLLLWNAEDVLEVSEHLEKAMSNLNSLGLMSSMDK